MMWNERKLVALSSGRDREFLAYTARLARLHRTGGATARPREVAPLEAASPLGVATMECASAVLSAPTELRYIPRPRPRPLPRLLMLAAQDDIDVMFVPESAGRGLARALAQRAAASIWFVPNGTPARFERILVPVDFSVRAADCLRVATGLASLSGGACLAVHTYFSNLVYSAESHAETLRRQCHANFVEFIQPIDFLGVPVKPIFEQAADPATAVLRIAARENSDLIVVSSRGRGLFANWLRPSIVDRLLRDSTIPVLVVKHFGAKRPATAVLRDSHAPGEQLPGCN